MTALDWIRAAVVGILVQTLIQLIIIAMVPSAPASVPPAPAPVTSVILYRGGEAKISPVKKVGPNCYVAWYENIEKLLIHRDGSAYSMPFSYAWTLNVPGPRDRRADLDWFDKNCLEPPTF